MKRLIKFFSYLFIICMTAWLAIFVAFKSDQIRGYLLEKLGERFSYYTNYRITVANVSPSFPLGLVFYDAAIFEEDKELLKIEMLKVHCSLKQLLKGELNFSHLAAEGIRILSLPERKFSSASPASVPIQIPLHFEKISIKDVKVEQNVLEKFHLPEIPLSLLSHSTFSLKGIFHHDPSLNILSSVFNLEIQGDGSLTHQISLNGELNTDTLAIHSVIHNLKGIDDSTVEALFDGIGPIRTWIALLTNEVGKEPILGTINLALQFKEPYFQKVKEVSLLTHYSIQSPQSLELNNLLLSDKDSKFEGKATLDLKDHNVNAHLKGLIIRESPLQMGETQIRLKPADIKGKIFGSLNDPSIELELHTQEQLLGHLKMTDPQLKITLPSLHNRIGHVLFETEINGHPSHASGHVEYAADSVKMTNILLQLPDIALDGMLTYFLPSKTWDGQLHAQCDHFATYQSLLPIELDGNGQVWMTLSPSPMTPNHTLIKGKIAASNIRQSNLSVNQAYGDFESIWGDNTLKNVKARFEADDIQSKDINVESLLTSVEIPDFNDIASGTVEAIARNLRTQALTAAVANYQGHLLPSKTDSNFIFTAQGLSPEKWNALVKGVWSQQSDKIGITLSEVYGQFGPYPFSLLEPLHFFHSSQQNVLESFSARWGEAEVKASWKQSEESENLIVESNQMPLELLHFFYPEFFFTGRVSVSGHFATNKKVSSGEVKLNLHHLQINEPYFNRPPIIDGSIHLSVTPDAGVKVQSQLKGVGHTPITAEGTLPLIIHHSPFRVEVSRSLPLSLAIQAQGDLDPYLDLFYNDTSNLGGKIRIAANIQGNINEPQVSGTIDLSEGFYESLNTGAIFRSIRANLEGNGSQILVKDFSALDDKGGEIKASGSILIDSSKNFPYTFQIHPQKISLLNSDYISMTASGPLTLQGDRQKGVIQGSLVVDKATIDIEQALPQQIKTVDFRFTEKQKDQSPPLYPESKPPIFPLELDVVIKAPGQVFIGGNHLESEWKGSLALTGTLQNLLLNGDMRIINGVYKFNGKEFELTQGNIHFAGPPGKKSTLYVIASKEIDRIRAEIIVNGPTNKPVVTLRSSPPLSQREILSYILFNRGIADITSDQGDQLSQSFLAINQTNQKSDSQDFLTRLRNNIGIDRLDLTSTTNGENKDFALQVGKYVTENIFISINKSISDIGNRVAIEAKLRKNLKAQAEVDIGGNSQGKVSLKWKKDY